MKREETINFVVVVFFIIGFFLLILSTESVTGFSVHDLELEEIDEADVILTLKDNSFYSDKDTVKSQQDKFVKLNNLKSKKNYDNINAIALRVNQNDIKKIIKDKNLKSISLDKKFKLLLDSSKNVVEVDRVWDKLVDGVNLTGSGSVCVLDTGVDYNHTDLIERVVLGPDYVNDDSDPMDDHGHGTHVGGIISSQNEIYKGIANGGNIIAVKVMDSGGGGVESDILAGIDWCINNKDLYNISVISMSIGTSQLFSEECDSLDPPFTNLVNEAVNQGMIVVSAAGNDYSSSSLPLPACISNIISVGAVDDSDNIASFSNSADFLDLLGPGISITSSYLGNSFKTYSGTSMATPHVSAAVLIVEQYAELENLNVSVIDVLKNSGVNVLDGRNGLEFPRINIFRALISLDSFEPELNSYFTPLEVYNDKNVTLSSGVSDTFLDSVWLELKNETYYVNSYVLSNLSIGENITFRFSANDSSGNIGAGEDKSFIVLDGKPVLNNIEKLTAKIGYEFNYNIIVIDPTNDSLNYSDDSELFDIGDTGLISFTPSEVSNSTVNISVSDGKHLVSDIFDLEVILNNSAPEIVSYLPDNLSFEINENESVLFSIVKEDLDDIGLSVGWYLDESLVSNQDNYTFVSDYTSSGNYNVTVIASDGIDSDSISWNMVVNDINLAPEFIGLIENISFDENTNYNLNLSEYFVDLDDALNYNMSLVDNISFVDGVIISDINFSGVRDVRFYGCDEIVCADSGLIEILVNNVAVCGDGLIEGEEECDGSFNNSCVDFDYDGGSLGCLECKFDFSSCTITPPSGGSAPSGGGGTPINDDNSEEITVEEKTATVKEDVKAEEDKPFEGEVVKEEVKPKGSVVRRVFVGIGDFFKNIWYKILSVVK